MSAPSLEWFEEQSAQYKESVLPQATKARVSIDAGISSFWRSYVGDHGIAIGIDHFGASADYKTLYQEFGITTQAVVDASRKALGK